MEPSVDLESIEQRATHIRQLASALVRNAHDAEDLAQDAWVRSLSSQPSRKDAWPAWIHATVRNLARLRWRADRRRDARESAVARAESRHSPTETLEQLDAFELLTKVVRELEEPYRASIVSRYFEGLPPREIARRAGVSVKTVDSRLARGLQQLRRRLDERHG